MGNVKTATQNDIQWGNFDADDTSRLDLLLAANAVTLRKREIFSSDREEFDALAMKRPISPEKAFAYLGLTLGSLGPLSILLKIAIGSNGFDPEFTLFIALFLVATAATTAIGFWTGKVVGRVVTSLRSRSWPTFIALSLLLGVAWGGFAGGLGGLFLFVIGGIFGAVIGSIAGAVVLPLFAVSHRLLSKGHSIELKHFLPVAFGSVLTICAFILGLN